MNTSNRELSRVVVSAMQPKFSFPTRSEERGMVNLRDNENPFGGPQLRYPNNMTHPLAEQYVRALDFIEQTSGPTFNPDTVLLTRGASDALDLIFRAFFEPGQDAVAVTPPNFQLFDELATVFKIGMHRVDLSGDDFSRIDVTKLAALPVKGIILCDPNNPVGSSIAADDIFRLLSSFNGLVVIDEAYVEYTRRQSWRHLIESHPNLLVVRSMSKGLGMAGLRLGAVFGREPLIKAMLKVRLPFALPRPVMEEATAELADPVRLRSQIDQFIAERDRFADQLRRYPLIERVFSDAGFITIKTRADLATLLAKKGFDAVPNPMGWTGYLRISIGMPEVNDAVMQVLNNAVQLRKEYA